MVISNTTANPTVEQCIRLFSNGILVRIVLTLPICPREDSSCCSPHARAEPFPSADPAGKRKSYRIPDSTTAHRVEDQSESGSNDWMKQAIGECSGCTRRERGWAGNARRPAGREFSGRTTPVSRDLCIPLGREVHQGFSVHFQAGT